MRLKYSKSDLYVVVVKLYNVQHIRKEDSDRILFTSTKSYGL